jgi:hypothetical protein
MGRVCRTLGREQKCIHLKGRHGKHRCRSEDNIKMDLKEIGWLGVDWTHLAWDTVHW